eukprot:s5248_g1.t1
MRMRMELVANAYAVSIAKALRIWSGAGPFNLWPSLEAWHRIIEESYRHWVAPFTGPDPKVDGFRGRRLPFLPRPAPAGIYYLPLQATMSAVSTVPLKASTARVAVAAMSSEPQLANAIYFPSPAGCLCSQQLAASKVCERSPAMMADIEETVRGDPLFHPNLQFQRRSFLGLEEPKMKEILSRTKFVSLGSFCGVAQALQSLGLRGAAGPFDWMRSRCEGVTQLLATNFKDEGILSQDRHR